MSNKSVQRQRTSTDKGTPKNCHSCFTWKQKIKRCHVRVFEGYGTDALRARARASNQNHIRIQREREYALRRMKHECRPLANLKGSKSEIRPVIHNLREELIEEIRHLQNLDKAHDNTTVEGVKPANRYHSLTWMVFSVSGCHVVAAATSGTAIGLRSNMHKISPSMMWIMVTLRLELRIISC